jgi:hypothetical protein
MEAEVTGAMVDKGARLVIARGLARHFEEVVTGPPPEDLVILLERLKVREEASLRDQRAFEQERAHQVPPPEEDG